MPRNPPNPGLEKYVSNLTRETIIRLMSPLATYSQCESSAFLREAITHAIKKDLASVHPSFNLIPSWDVIGLEPHRHLSYSKDEKYRIKVIETPEHIEHAAQKGAVTLRNARTLLQQAALVPQEVSPILYYYGSLSFLEFITSALVWRERESSPGHGVSMSAEDEGWDFDADWPTECFVRMSKQPGDFHFIVDALTIGGWPSLFSSFRLHRDSKISPWEVRSNPNRLLISSGLLSLHELCNFDLQKYINDHPELIEWFKGADRRMILKMTTILMDFLIVFLASNLARYRIPAWQAIIQAHKSDIYNDISLAFRTVAEGLPLFFEDQHPFQYSFGTRIR